MPHQVTSIRSPLLYWFALLTTIGTLLLMAWGAFVTSIDAGLAVPDWPTSFNSFDPINPKYGWWRDTPVLAEHGHRLIGALVGLLTIGLAIMTLAIERRRSLRLMTIAALGLVIFQGVLGGLRVVLIDLDLAILHAVTAQVFFSLLAAITLMHSKAWGGNWAAREGLAVSQRLLRPSALLVVALFVQIALGALLRHRGAGVSADLAAIHIAWGFVVAGLVGLVVHRFVQLWPSLPDFCHTLALLLATLLLVQVALGFGAWSVLLTEGAEGVRSVFQVLLNSFHLLTAALLAATSVLILLVVNRMRRAVNVDFEPVLRPLANS